MADKKSVDRLTSRFKSVKDKLDMSIDRRLTKVGEKVDKSSRAADRYGASAREKASDIKDSIDDVSARYIDSSISKDSFYTFFDKMVEKPKMTVIITLLITAVLVFPLVNWTAIDAKVNDNESPPNMLGYLNLNMDAAFDVYLPEGEETSDILNEVRANWTVDLFVLYVETQNAFDKDLYKENSNVTNSSILQQISKIEFALNYAQNDKGKEDDVIYVFSIAKIIREFNGSAPRVAAALWKQAEKASGVEIPGEDLVVGNVSGNDSIPNSQERVDDYIKQVEPNIIDHFVKDTNKDGIWDSTLVLLGLRSGLNFDDIVERVRGTYTKMVRKYNKDPDVDAAGHKLVFRDTGTIPVTKDVQDRSTEEGIRALVIAVIFVLLTLFFFHRTLKILFIALIPVAVSIAITFSIISIVGLPITPQVIVVGPIIIALGVAYGLYIANRYAEEAQIEDRVERAKVAVRTTGKAVFLSAVTTAGGFASLMVTNIMPMRTVGLTLTMGIMINYVIAVIMVPSLVLLLDYHKREDSMAKMFKKVSPVPADHNRKILGATVVLIIISSGLLMGGAIESNVDFLDFAPDDQESLVTFKDYARIFEGGATGMVIIRGRAAQGDDYEGSMKDYDVLKEAEYLEEKIGEVEATWPVSIIDIFKTIRADRAIDAIDDDGSAAFIINTSESLGLVNFDTYENQSLWDTIEDSPENQQPYNTRLFWIEVTYDSLTDELKHMLLNDDYSKMLIYVDMPVRDVESSRSSVEGVNEQVEKWKAGQSTSVLTGVAAIGLTVNDLIFLNAMQSLILALLFVLIVLLIIFRSVRYSVLTIIPLACAVAMLPLTFKSVNAALTIITAMLGSIVVGAGVDFSIHMTERVREEGGKRGETVEGVKTAIETTGRSFMEATTVTLAGLTAGYFIPIASIWKFIGLIQILLVVCMMSAMFLLPSIYIYLIRGKLYDEFTYGRGEEREEVDDDEPIPVEEVVS